MTAPILVGGCTLHLGDCRGVLKTLPDESVHCVVTSPPYIGLRDYGVEGQIGLEPTPDEFVAAMVGVFRDVRRVLRSDGTCWLNLGDSYAGSWGAQGKGGPPSESSTLMGNGHSGGGPKLRAMERFQVAAMPIKQSQTGTIRQAGLKPKDLIGAPWRVALALQADGWWLRSDIIWSKPNPMPESVTDRPTKAHEYVFLLTKSARYFYDAKAIAEVAAIGARRSSFVSGYDIATKRNLGMKDRSDSDTRNARSVWTIATQPCGEAHFAMMPPSLAERCIKAGCPVGGTVLDPFWGAGTTGLVAERLQRRSILIELNPKNRDMAARRIAGDAPLLVAGADPRSPIPDPRSPI